MHTWFADDRVELDRVEPHSPLGGWIGLQYSGPRENFNTRPNGLTNWTRVHTCNAHGPTGPSTVCAAGFQGMIGIRIPEVHVWKWIGGHICCLVSL